jgi:hypothetical protein
MKRRPVHGSVRGDKKKARSFERLKERYHGKRALLASWEATPGLDMDYRRDLARRVNGHKSDIIYRGGDV